MAQAHEQGHEHGHEPDREHDREADRDGLRGNGMRTASHLMLEDPEETHRWEEVAPRKIPEARWRQFEGYMAEIFEAFGMDLDTPGTVRTPERFLRAIFEATAGYEGDPKLLTAFPTECRGGPDCSISQIVEGPISFFALCEHHALPFFGNAYVGYVAHEGIIGISKLTRLVRVFGCSSRTPRICVHR